MTVKTFNLWLVVAMFATIFMSLCVVVTFERTGYARAFAGVTAFAAGVAAAVAFAKCQDAYETAVAALAGGKGRR